SSLLPLGRLDDGDGVLAAVDVREGDLHPLVTRGRQVLADVVRADGQLAVPAVDEDGELDPGRAAEVVDRVEGGADRAPGVEDVVDEDDGGAVDPAGGQLGAEQGAGGLGAQVVAVHRDVERAELRAAAGGEHALVQ